MTDAQLINAFVLLVVIIISEAIFDFFVISKGKQITGVGHWFRFMGRACAMWFVAHHAYDFHPDMGLKAAGLMVLMGAIFWAAFDALLNILRGLPIVYVGKSAMLDRIWQPPGLQFVAKAVVLAGAWLLWANI
jgi:hypothetical protein